MGNPKTHIQMISINYGSPRPLEEALIHLSTRYLKSPEFSVKHHDSEYLRVSVHYAGSTAFSSYEGQTSFLIHLLQLTQAMLGKEMEGVPVHDNLMDAQRVRRLSALGGEMKVKTVLAFMGGMIHVNITDGDFTVEDVCKAYAEHVEDPSKSMHDHLQLVASH